MAQSSYNAEIDFRDLVRHPWKLLGYAYGYYFAILVGVGLLYVFNLTDIGKNSVPARVLADSSAFAQDIPYQSAAVIPPVDVKVVGRPSDSLITQGRIVFQGNCASCHGDQGQGDGAGGVALNPKPRNFHTAEGWTNGAKVSSIYRTLEEGIVRNGMASYNYLAAKDRFALAHLIRSWVPNAPVDAESELANLETVYQLSKGQIRPAQIPVKKATEIIVRESAPFADAVARRASLRSELARLPALPGLLSASRPVSWAFGWQAGRSDSAGGERGAAVFARFAVDPTKALIALTARGYRLGSADDLVRIVTADPVRIGFRVSVTRLTAEEWAALHQYLSRSDKQLLR
ncbi:MAG: c-type cytochrome [Bacteroidota bacterium]